MGTIYKLIAICVIILLSASCHRNTVTPIDTDQSTKLQETDEKTYIRQMATPAQERSLCFTEIGLAYDGYIFNKIFELEDWECAKYLDEYNEKIRSFVLEH